MSTYRSGRSRFTFVRHPTSSELLDAAIRTAFATTSHEWVGSSELLSLTRLSGKSLAEAIEGNPMTSALLRAGARPQLTKAFRVLNAARQADSVGDVALARELSSGADRLLIDALRTTAGTLQLDERRLATAATERALTRLGYTVDTHHGRRSAGVWATRGDTAVAVLVHDGGAVDLDWAGCAGGACATPMAELEKAWADEGLVVDVHSVAPHGDDRGGLLIARASSAAGGGRRAVGLVVQHEAGVLGTDSRSPVAQVRHRAAVEQ